MPNRNISLDVARGALILYIVTIIHGIYWLNINSTYTSYLLFEMPCIFLITGYAYCIYITSMPTRDPTLRIKSYLRYIGLRLNRIFIPYYVYAGSCYVIFAILFLKDHREEASPSKLIRLAVDWLIPFSEMIKPSNNSSLLSGPARSHLWFILPFILVTVLLPILTKIRVGFKCPLWLWMLIAFLLVLGISYTRFPASRSVQSTVFYSIWAVFGYHLAKQRTDYSQRDYLLTLVISLCLIVATKVIAPRSFSWDMQMNKFPPNATFFAFSCAWVSLLLMFTSKINPQWTERLSRVAWFRLFIDFGFTLYLWQGLGYTFAKMLGDRLRLPLIAVWFSAILLTIFLGKLAAPTERIRMSWLTRNA